MTAPGVQLHLCSVGWARQSQGGVDREYKGVRMLHRSAHLSTARPVTVERSCKKAIKSVFQRSDGLKYNLEYCSVLERVYREQSGG